MTMPVCRAAITGTSKDGDVVYFEIEVSCSTASWQVPRRYSEFDSLRSQLEKDGITVTDFPRKLLFNTDGVIAERRIELSDFINCCVLPNVQSTACRAFLELDQHQSGAKASSQGPGVVLFPSLAGSVLDCEDSPVEGYEGSRIWMGLTTLLGVGGGQKGLDLEMSAGTVVQTQNPFVQHMTLHPNKLGEDNPGYVVRAKEGLAGCEYLSEVPLIKPETVIMGVITDMLRKYDYCEWDPSEQFGSMIGASYDWRLTPPLLEERDQFFSRMMEQTEAMVAADPQRRPAVVIGFSLGSRIAKYFIHFCHAKKGAEWMSRSICAVCVAVLRSLVVC